MDGDNKRLVTIDDEPYYPAEKFEEEVGLLAKFVHDANVLSVVAVVLSAVAISLAILL